jgi:hypothetical protein
MAQPEDTNRLTPAARETLFLELAGRPDGVSGMEAHAAGDARGDRVTVEAYHNLGRRLASRGLLRSEQKDRVTRYFAVGDGQWLDEDELARIVNPDYPLIALTAAKRMQQELRSLPDEVWIAAREILRGDNARALFSEAITGYADLLRDELQHIRHEETPGKIDSNLRHVAEDLILILQGLAKFGLGLSDEAIHVPTSAAAALRKLPPDEEIEGFHFYTQDVLLNELATRIANESMVVDAPAPSGRRRTILAGVDGSTRGGLLSLEGEHGELVVGHAPMVSINTAVARLNGHVSHAGKNRPAFLRLPEKPEDMQQRDNRYTVMAKLFFPDLNESEFAHSLWNAMDLLEARATQRVLSRWYLPGTSAEVPPADVVFRDGAAAPNDRDFTHYHTQNAYGKIVRDLIEANWEIARKCRDDGQTVAGIIKTAYLRILAPVINWRLKEVAARGRSPLLERWPLRQFNLVEDQTLLTRILTVGIGKGAPWVRSALILRPFHATTNFALWYRRSNTPSQKILEQWHKELATPEPENRSFWEEHFKGDRDPYVQMLHHVNYASVFVGAVPQLDVHKSIPRLEIVVPASTEEDRPDRLAEATRHLENALAALHSTGFDVAKEHAMFNSPATLDLLPRIIIRTHETVKEWAAELLARVSEFIGYKLREHRINTSNRAIRLRKLTKTEFEAWVNQMQAERDRSAGSRPGSGSATAITGNGNSARS